MTLQQTTIGSSIKWAALSQIARMAAQIIGLIVLARLLPPSDFGVISMGSVAVGFASLFRDMGTTAALIQRKALDAAICDTVFWMNVVIGLTLALVIISASPLIAIGFGERRLIGVLQMLACVFPITSLGALHQALLERASNFRSLAFLESVSAFVGLAVAIVVATFGGGVYSLVAQTLASAMAMTGGLWAIFSWRPTYRFCSGEIRGLVKFSGNLVGFNVVNYFVRNADNILIGRFLGASDLGHYALAYKLMLWPLQNISGVIARALFPAFSRMQQDKLKIVNSYMQVTAAVVLVTAPLMFGLFVLREPFVSVTLGDKWLPVASLLYWLAPVGFLQSIGTLVGNLYLASGRTDLMFKWGLSAGMLALLAFVIGLRWGVIGVAMAYFFFSAIIFWPSLAIPCRLFGIRVPAMLIRVIPTVLVAFMMAVIVSAVAWIWPRSPHGELFRLSALIVLGITAYLVFSLTFQRRLVVTVWAALLRR